MVSIRTEIGQYGLRLRKGWGQHFLVDRNILKKIVHAAQVESGDVILEIGPGLGEMTLALARKARKVIAIEIDPQLVEILREKRTHLPNVEIIQGDVLRVNLRDLASAADRPIKVVANLPYQVSTPLLFRFIESREFFSTLTLMLQREVAERMTAFPGQKTYGPLSVLTQSVSVVSVLFFVKPSAFFPPPKVESAVVRLTWREEPIVEPCEEEWFRVVVKGVLLYRRKTLANALKHSGLPLPRTLGKRLEGIGIDPLRRPETLSLEEFAALARALKP